MATTTTKTTTTTTRPLTAQAAHNCTPRSLLLVRRCARNVPRQPWWSSWTYSPITNERNPSRFATLHCPQPPPTQPRHPLLPAPVSDRTVLVLRPFSLASDRSVLVLRSLGRCFPRMTKLDPRMGGGGAGLLLVVLSQWIWSKLGVRGKLVLDLQ